MFNIIGDIAGRYDELIALLNKMPRNKIILVGDLVDRGPDSKKVVEWAMSNPNVITIKGNHEDMMVQSFYGVPGDHLYNGGIATARSYGVKFPSDYPEDHIKWMMNLPLFFQADGLFVSHAPWLETCELGEVYWDHSVLWNRYPPVKRKGVFQVFGHNHRMEKYGDWAICVDDCSQQVLTGMTFPDKVIYQEPYR